MNNNSKKPSARLAFGALKQSDMPAALKILENHLPDYAGIPPEKLSESLRKWPLGALGMILQKRWHCIVAKDGATIAGLLIYNSDAKTTHIDLVLVTPRYKGQGLSKDLFILFSRTVENFYKSFSLNVTNSNKAFTVYRHYEQKFLLRRGPPFQDHVMGRRTNFVGKTRIWAALKPKRPALAMQPRRPPLKGVVR